MPQTSPQKVTFQGVKGRFLPCNMPLFASANGTKRRTYSSERRTRTHKQQSFAA